MFWTILTRVQLMLQGITNFPTVQIRKRLFHSRDHGDTLPLCILSPANEEMAAVQFKNSAMWDYSIHIGVYQQIAGAVQSASELQWMMARREEIRKTLYVPKLEGIETVFSVAYQSNPLYPWDVMDNQVELSVQQITYRVSEGRAYGGG